MSVDLESARGVVLDVMERSADLEEALTARIGAGVTVWQHGRDGATVPPVGHPYRSDFEAWAESAGCSDGRRGFQAPRFPDRDGRLVGLWTVAKGRFVPGNGGRKWSGQVVSFEDWVADDADTADRVAADIRALLEIRRFAAHPPTDAELMEGWGPPACVALERHEADILDGVDTDYALPADVADWLRKLVHPPKAAYAADYCRHRLYGEPEPSDPGAPWAVKARKRGDRILQDVTP